MPVVLDFAENLYATGTLTPSNIALRRAQSGAV
jgi:hypothetical protein